MGGVRWPVYVYCDEVTLSVVDRLADSERINRASAFCLLATHGAAQIPALRELMEANAEREIAEGERLRYGIGEGQGSDLAREMYGLFYRY